MAFTVGDFRDLIELLAQHPEWRAELRRHVLSDEILELPALVRQLVEAQSRTEAAVADLAAAQARTEAQIERVEAAIERLTEAQARTEARMDGFDARMDRLEAQMGRFETQMGRLDARQGSFDCKLHEMDFVHRGAAYLSKIARRLQVVHPQPLANMLDDAVDEGRLIESEREAIMLADSVLTGRRRSDGQDIYLLVEVSAGVGPYDVERAVERAMLLEKLGHPVVPVVAGSGITDEAEALAQERGVWYAEGGRVVPPRGA